MELFQEVNVEMTIPNNMIYEFCLYSVLSKLKSIDVKEKNAEKILSAIIQKANSDTMTGMRYNSEYNKCDIMDVLKDYYMRTCIPLDSISTIEYLKNKYTTISVGAIQKIVNMSLKYIVCFNAVFGYEVRKVNVDKCDCPLDSQILKSIGLPSVKWTKISSMEEYKSIQDRIREKMGDDDSLLMYDFMEWR